LDQYDYQLPEELIANQPSAARDSARLLVLHRKSGQIEHGNIRDLPAFLQSGDCLVFNDTRVVPARLFGTRSATGGHWEGLYLSSPRPGVWRIIGQTRGKLKPGEKITIHPAHDPTAIERLQLTLIEREFEGIWHCEADSRASPFDLLERFGTVPL